MFKLLTYYGKKVYLGKLQLRFKYNMIYVRKNEYFGEVREDRLIRESIVLVPEVNE